MKKTLITLLILSSLSFANTQGNLTQYKPTPTSSTEVSNILNNPENQNNAELMMFILKSIEDKNITDKQKKIEFVNSFHVSEDIKQYAISLINQNITYSDNEKVSYGIYSLKLCNGKLRKPNDSCYIDESPDGHGG